MSKNKQQKYSYGSAYSYDGYKRGSSFWYDDYNYDYDYLDNWSTNYTPTQLASYKKTNNLYKLASVRRAIANFVQIVSGKPIPVSFATKSDSKTDGQKVILSADVEDKFDVSVGLALHEGSHIVLSNFDMLRVFSNLAQSYHLAYFRLSREIENAEADGLPNPHSDVMKSMNFVMIKTINCYITDKGVTNEMIETMRDIFISDRILNNSEPLTKEITDTIAGLTNWVEDRRIDNYIFRNAPGYRDYYNSMYDHYFNDKSVTKAIASDEFTDETINSYMFRIINMLNSETKLSKLKGLRTIYHLLDLKNIDRLKSSNDAYQLALAIVSEIMKHTTSDPSNDGGIGSQAGDDETGEIKINIGGGDGDDNDGAGGMTVSGVNVDGDGTPSNSPDDRLSKTLLEKVIKKFQKQKEFLNGEVKKKTISKEEANKLSDIQESEAELVRVGSDYQSSYGNATKGVDCIVVKRLTNKLISDADFPFSRFDYSTKEPQQWATDEVQRGITLGILLGKKLQVRGESRETIFNRLKRGKIDKRLISSLGYDNEGVFYTNEIDQFKKANLHISLDYSGSMGGHKLRKTITSTVAIVKACLMARNINVQVSIRSTDSGRHGGKSLPYICLIHDSRRDSFKQFAKYMSILECNNTTPEGLCFEAIQKYLIPTDNGVDSYFLNFSDGQPAYSINTKDDIIHYSGDAAAEHTNRQVKKMIANGINVLSYFITERSSDSFESSSDWSVFKKCYGNGAKHVNVENVMQVAKTMNDMFLTKPNKQ